MFRFGFKGSKGRASPLYTINVKGQMVKMSRIIRQSSECSQHTLHTLHGLVGKLGSSEGFRTFPTDRQRDVTHYNVQKLQTKLQIPLDFASWKFKVNKIGIDGYYANYVRMFKLLQYLITLKFISVHKIFLLARKDQQILQQRDNSRL